MLEMKREDDEFVASKYDKNQDADLDELEEALEDEDIDNKMFEEYRAKRLAEMKEQSAKNKYGGLRHVTAQDYVREVTNAPEGDLVVVHLYQDYIPECVVLNRVLEELSQRHKEVKFCKIKANDANADYPDKALPTVCIYKNKDVLDKVVAMKTNGGRPITPDGLEWRFAQQGFMKTELVEDPFQDVSMSQLRVLHGHGTKGKVGYNGS